MAGKYDDSDIKIVSSDPNEEGDKFDALEFIEETKKQRFNGNTAKAKTLGANIVSAFSYKAAPEELTLLAADYSVELNENTLLQMKILSVFSAEYCLNNFLPSPMLSGIAVGELYDVLMDVSPDFYEELSGSMAFSFYYLCVRSEKNTTCGVGEQFAMLCGKKGDNNYIELGKKLHEINVSVYKKAIKAFAFV